MNEPDDSQFSYDDSNEIKDLHEIINNQDIEDSFDVLDAVYPDENGYDDDADPYVFFCFSCSILCKYIFRFLYVILI